jgi:hypothetical protein
MKTTAIWYVTPCNLAKSINISQKPAASIFRVRESPKRKEEGTSIFGRGVDA